MLAHSAVWRPELRQWEGSPSQCSRSSDPQYTALFYLWCLKVTSYPNRGVVFSRLTRVVRNRGGLFIWKLELAVMTEREKEWGN